AALDGLRLGAESHAAGRGRATFGERLRIDRAALNDPLVVDRPPPLVFGSRCRVHVEVVGEWAGPQRRADMHVPGQRGGAAITADVGGSERIGLVVGAKSAMLLRDGYPEQAGAVQILVVLGREFGIAVVGRGAVRENHLAQFARPSDDSSLLVIEPECRGIE